MDLEDLSAIYSDDNRVVVIENLDDIGEPYTCEQWASGAEDYQFFTDDGDFIFFHQNGRVVLIRQVGCIYLSVF